MSKNNKMSKNSKMSEKDKKIVELLSGYFNEARTEYEKEKLNEMINIVNKAKSVKSYLCLINLEDATLANCSGFGDDIIHSVRTVCSDIREDEKEKKMLWIGIAKTILEVLEEN